MGSHPIVEVNGPFLPAVQSLLGVTCAQTVFYFRTYPRDRLVLKVLVAFFCLLEGVHVAFLAEFMGHQFIFCKVPENTQFAFFATRPSGMVLITT
ncbi:hypothetical protein DXG01_013123, partial [Tephrocybe rancida]